MKQINIIAYRSYVKNPQLVIKAYKNATFEPFSYLLMDFTQTCPDYLRLWSDIFPKSIDNYPPTIYLPNDKPEIETPFKKRRFY